MATSTSGLRKKDEKIAISNQELFKAQEKCGKLETKLETKPILDDRDATRDRET